MASSGPTDTADQRSWARRLLGKATVMVLGPASTRRLTATHAIDDVADSLITLSLVGSLFFSVSLEASRSRILLYLLLTAAPLALVAPVIGPVLERVRAGFRSVILASQLARAFLALGLAASLLSLAFYPLVFGVLLSRKVYALGKTAILGQLAPDREVLVAASGHIARTGTVAGGLGTAFGGAVIALGDVTWLPVFAAIGYLAAAAVTSTIERTARVDGVAASVARAETPPSVRRAAASVAALRAAAGALTFLLAIAIKRGGGDEWIFAAALVAAGLGAFAGTVVAPRLHRRLPSDRIVLLTLLVPGLISAFGVLTIGSGAIVAIAATIGLAGSVASRTMDALYAQVPDRVRGRVIAWIELGFQMANVVGAILAVSADPSPRVGFAVVAVVLVVAGLGTASRMRVSLRREAGRWLLGAPIASAGLDLPHALLAEAVRAVERQEFAAAIVLADAAQRAAAVTHAADGVEPHVDDLGWLVTEIAAGRAEATAELATEAIAAADAGLQRWGQGEVPSERS
jgi:predicted MFS family arabinose efflux permease